MDRHWTPLLGPGWRFGKDRVAHRVDTLRTLAQEGAADSFDLAFIDADKIGYDDYFDGALRLVRRCGVIVLDNMLWDGRVADPNDTEPNTCALRKLNMKIAGDPRVDHVLLALASGMTLVQRRA
jgi:O-methyltransferase